MTMSQWIDSNNSSTKNTRATRYESYKTRGGYEYVKLDTAGANEGWVAKEVVRHEVRAVRENSRQKTRDVQEDVRGDAWEST